MSQTIVDLTYDECMELLTSQVVGRVALNTPVGMRIIPVNYAVNADDIVWRTTPYSELATYGPDRPVAFEIDNLDHHAHEGWSVVVHGVVRVVDDPDDVARIRSGNDPSPWADGLRHLYMRVPVRDISGRRIGAPGGASTGPH